MRNRIAIRLTPLADQFGWIAGHDGEFWHIHRNYRPGCDYSTSTDSYAAEHNCAIADPDIGADSGGLAKVRGVISSQLERMRVDPGAIDGQAPGEFGSIDQLGGWNRVSLKQVNDPPRDCLNGSGVQLDATRFHDPHPLCP